MRKLALLGVLLACLVSCSEEEQPAEQVQMDKHGAVEIEIKSHKTDSTYIIQSLRNVFGENGQLIKTFVTYDTLPVMGFVKDTIDTGRKDEDDEPIDTIISHRRDYKLYITVKSK